MLIPGEHNVLTLTMHLVSVHSSRYCIIEALSCTNGLIMIFWKRSHICLFPEKHHNTHKNQPSLWSVSLWTMERKNFKQKHCNQLAQIHLFSPIKCQQTCLVNHKSIKDITAHVQSLQQELNESCRSLCSALLVHPCPIFWNTTYLLLCSINIHPFIFFRPNEGHGEAWAYFSCDRKRNEVHSGQVTSL